MTNLVIPGKLKKRILQSTEGEKIDSGNQWKVEKDNLVISGK